MNLQNTNERQQQKQKQKRQEGKNKCKDKNLDNPSRLIEAPEGMYFQHLPPRRQKPRPDLAVLRHG
jgi:hypothetical protein